MPLSPAVLALLGDSLPNSLDANIARLVQIAEGGAQIGNSTSRKILRIANDIVVKIGQGLDLNELATLQYIKAYVPLIPVPHPLGALQVGRLTYIFMSYVPGVTLESCWHNLTPDQKQDVTIQLNSLLSLLRSPPHATGTPLGSLSEDHCCKDTRMSTHFSSSMIFTESDFNDFLVSRPLKRVSTVYLKWLRSLFFDQHRIVMTHGDLHPRNIMVQNTTDNGIQITSIIDWEMGGWYPEHWELVKMFNTRGSDDESDWWGSIPEVVSHYHHDVALHMLLERAVLP